MSGRAAPVTVTVEAPAKLTMWLRVIGRRPDGYHDIEAEMVSVDLADELQFDPAGDGLVVERCGPARHGLDVPASADNLVARALVHAGRRARVRVLKRIPAGAGLGGGSADAAAVLRWAGRTSPADVAGAARLGADVPFCVHGGRAHVSGLGDVIEPLPFVARTYTLCIPPFGVPTGPVYAAWAGGARPTGPTGNDLEVAALAVEPRLAQWRDRLGAHAGRRPTLAGSGSTWFVEGAYPGAGFLVVRAVPASPPCG